MGNEHRALNTAHPHSLVSREPGKNRFTPGRYVCKCGAEFTGLNQWEKHRSEIRENAR